MHESQYIQRHQPAFLRATLALFSGAFVTFASLYSTQALLPTLSQQFSITPAEASLSLSVATASLAIALLIIPSLSDRVGRKPVMIGALFTASVLGCLLPFVSQYSLLLLIRGLQGFALAGLASVAMTYVNEEFSGSCRGLAMGLYVSGTTVGGMSGRIITGYITEHYDGSTALTVMAAINLAGALIFTFTLPASRHFTLSSLSRESLIKGFLFHLQQPIQLSRFLHGFLLMGALVTLYNYISFRLIQPPYGLTEGDIGTLFLLYLLGTFSSAWIGSQLQHYRANTLIACCLMLMMAGALLSLHESFWLLLIAIGIFTFGFFGVHAIVSSQVGADSPRYKAQASALYLLFYYAGSSLIGAVGGLFWLHRQWPGVVFLIVTLIMLSITISVISHRRSGCLAGKNGSQPDSS